MAKRPRAKKKQAGSEKGITRISVRGFKSIAEECSIEIRPLTILAGANSSGKSSIVQPLLLLKQTLECGYDPGPLKLDGPNVLFTSSEQILSKPRPTSTDASFAISVHEAPSDYVTDTFKKRTNTQIQLVESTYKSGDEKIVLRPGMSEKELSSQGYLLRDEVFENSRKPYQRKVVRDGCFLEVGFYEVPPRERAIWYSMTAFSWPKQCLIRSVIHVPGVRGNPERSYKKTAAGPEFPGTFENYVASVISHWQNEKDEHLKDVGRHLEKLGLTWKVDATEIDATRVELRVARLRRGARGGARDMVNVADVGFGVSQVLPVLVALLVAEPGQLVYLEQPELHLHPKAQVALAQILAEAANRGVRVVTETHSALLLLATQTLVAEGFIPPERAILHWFERENDGVTKVTSRELDDAGAFGDWPEDFAEVTLKAQQEYLDAAGARRWSK